MSDEELTRQIRTDRAQEQARLYADEALLTIVGLMRSSADEKMKFKCAMAIINRAYGAPKQVIEGDAGGSIIEVLAQISGGNAFRTVGEGSRSDTTLEAVAGTLCEGGSEG